MLKFCRILSTLVLFTAVPLLKADSDLLRGESTPTGNGFYESEWLGVFFTNDSDWIYQSGLGWLYCTAASTTDAMWLYSLDLGWIFTGNSTFPSIYTDGSKAWIYFSDESSGDPLFYNFSGEYFFSLGAPDSATQVVSEGDLVTRAHEVSGQVQILNNGVIEITGFNYDGGGVDVRAVVSTSANYDDFTVLTGDLLLDGGYSGATLRFYLPNDFSTDQLLYLSIWCIPVRISFGDVVLAP
ncbi:DM13 domain-containing protein [Rubellicoccus peritrichatus]|uniref:DM13 domain-containing protein n=1 Tax=Rubellicoccus peritrichatus TaxID=3080537 RepID=A0AAQ3LC22_9BACT|nr:DM13 domain-containing protein [Puniceicoccus sp. CR14]WOO43011.1 DM13 domain-containing protein [Puniceicoccus sp. CR14]